MTTISKLTTVENSMRYSSWSSIITFEDRTAQTLYYKNMKNNMIKAHIIQAIESAKLKKGCTIRSIEYVLDPIKLVNGISFVIEYTTVEYNTIKRDFEYIFISIKGKQYIRDTYDKDIKNLITFKSQYKDNLKFKIKITSDRDKKEKIMKFSKTNIRNYLYKLSNSRTTNTGFILD